MFRYIALAWNPHIVNADHVARQFGQVLQAAPGWSLQQSRAGLLVFVTGGRDRVNVVYPLSGADGLVLGKLFRRSELNHRPSREVQLTDSESQAIVSSRGQALIDRFWGRYVAFLPASISDMLVVRDSGGALPCFRTRHEGVHIVFSWLEDLLTALPLLPRPRVSWPGLAAHLLHVKISGHGTALEGIHKVLPGEVVALGEQDGACTLLWDAAAIALQPQDMAPEQAAPQLRRMVRACAQHWASCHDHLLLRLSGGVDSSILLSCLDHQATASRVTCVNYHSPGHDSDERSFARLAARRAKRELVERERDAQFHLEQVLDIARTPEPCNYVGRTGTGRMDAMLARERGADALFTGAGGDQLFFQMRGCWPAGDYLQLRGLDAGFPGALMDAARLGRVSVWRALLAAVRSVGTPSETWRSAGMQLALVNQEALPRHLLSDEIVHPALLRARKLPMGKAFQTRQLLHPLDGYDPFEREAAPELVHPLLSQPLVELCLKLPTYVLTHGGRGRALAREAFANDMPAEIAGRWSKGGMGEHLQHILHRSMGLARSLLLDGELVRHGLLNRARVEEALSDRPTALAAHLHEIHVCIGIEAWLQRWPRNLGSSPPAA